MGLEAYWTKTGFYFLTWGNIAMYLVGMFFIWLAIKKNFEPLLLVPVGFGIVVGNIPPIPGLSLSVYDAGSVLSYLYFGISHEIFPPLIFLGIGAMTDFSAMISNPKLILLGAAAQIGIFCAFLGSMWLGFSAPQAASIGIIGGADGPTAIFLASALAPELLGPIAICAYSYIAMVPLIQPPIMYLLTTKEERKIKMVQPRIVSKQEKMIFPVIAFLVCGLMAPGALSLVGMLFLGNLLKESLVTERLANTARNALLDICTIMVGFLVGCSTQAQVFLTFDSIKIFLLGAFAFGTATAGGILFAKFMNLFLSVKNKINPLIGAAGVSAVPNSARVAHVVAQKADPTNFILQHAMAPNVAGVIGSAIAAGVMWVSLGK